MLNALNEPGRDQEREELAAKLAERPRDTATVRAERLVRVICLQYFREGAVDRGTAPVSAIGPMPRGTGGANADTFLREKSRVYT